MFVVFLLVARALISGNSHAHVEARVVSSMNLYNVYTAYSTMQQQKSGAKLVKEVFILHG